ncbi:MULTISPECIES: PepSY domain-containing protein [unclassified Paenibacillus]|uniref:PepSY domain-containing protein n=1 Tax=unclassified Paenibacillus TaxID=185978 RepID=UPI0009AEFB1B|nr:MULTISPECIES: PepSY domain-containing protein [unclassified Paenibacillus]MBE1443992.1 putative membrane protein YkoI [Paenibacillus sp. OAS669]
MNNKVWGWAAVTALIIGAGMILSHPASADPASVPAPAESEQMMNYDEQVAAEQAELQKQAKITKDQSVTIAKKKVDGKVQEVMLGIEDGTVVYNVFIEDKHSQVMEVKVDANTGKVIAVEQTDNDMETVEDME